MGIKRNFNVPIKNLDGTLMERTIYKTLPNGMHEVDEKGAFKFDHVEPVLIKHSLFDLLGGRFQSDVQLTGAQLLARYKAGVKIFDAGNGDADLEQEDVAAIYEVLEKGASPILYGMTKKILDTDPAPKEAPAT